MAMTLRLSATDEVLLREVADADSRNMTDEIVALVRERHQQIAESSARAEMRLRMRAAFLNIEREDAEALELLSR